VQSKNQVVGKCPLLATEPSSGHLYDVVSSSPSSSARAARTLTLPSWVHLLVLARQECERREKVGNSPTKPLPAPTQFVWNLPSRRPSSSSSPRSGLNLARGWRTCWRVVSQLGRLTRSSKWSINSLTSSNLPPSWAILATISTSWITSLATGCFALLQNFLTSSQSSKCLDLSQKLSSLSSSSLLLLLIILLLLLLLSGSKQQRVSEQLGHFDSVGSKQLIQSCAEASGKRTAAAFSKTSSPAWTGRDARATLPLPSMQATEKGKQVFLGLCIFI